MSRALVPVYALTLLLSAALLFAVQPMFGKMVLPLLGGTPAVWNTLMVFFQAALLGGYAYAHLTSRLMTIRAQATLHILLLFVCLYFLPIHIPSDWIPPQNENPSLWVLTLAAAVVGGPFFVLAGSAPMFQRWFAKTEHPDADNPYFLYAASNLGSLTVLLLYPLLFEPLMGLVEQSRAWMAGYAGLILMVIAASTLVWGQGRHHADELAHDAAWRQTAPTWERRILWVVLSFVPSSLMLGVTLHVTTDVASVPLLWVVPLALYLLTFVIVFARKPWISHQAALAIHLGVLVFFVILSSSGLHYAFLVFIGVHFTTFFFTALMCHWELSATRPDAAHLTEFYLWMSVGGVLGGIFNGLLAPVLFDEVVEYYAVLAAACLVRGVSVRIDASEPLFAGIRRDLSSGLQRLAAFDKKSWPALFGITLALLGALLSSLGVGFQIFFVATVVGLALLINVPSLLALGLLVTLFTASSQAPGKFADGERLYQHRNFFGVMSVGDMPSTGLRHFFHGNTLHGLQSLAEAEKRTPWGYYHLESPLAEVFEELDRRTRRTGPQKVADLGLGVGVAACYGSADRSFTFFEIDPAVAEVAENPEFFTFLSGCGAPYEIIIGDGRLAMEAMPDESFDLVFVDAFTSDNIPVHLITKEALAIYVGKTKPGGLVALHISNRFLNLEHPLAAIAAELGIAAVAKYGIAETGKSERETQGLRYLTSHVVVMAREEADLGNLPSVRGWRPMLQAPGFRPWTDDHSNLVDVLWTKDAMGQMLAAQREAMAEPSAPIEAR